ncbi:MAG: transketolase family protein [Anaerolineales bacterium]|nr:MAG: transketolase family protein [Anaerolineales bacterium]
MSGRESPYVGLSSRDAFGKVLVELGRTNPRIVALTADLGSSVRTAWFAEEFPDRAFNFGIAEQDMMGAAAGLALAGKIPFVSTYAVFASLRAAEQARTDVAYGNVPVRICASHSGLTIGPGGPTHQSIEDVAIYRGMPNMTVIVPADGVGAAAATRAAADLPGPAYMRLSRAKEPTVYRSEKGVHLGIANTVRQGTDLTIIACGPCVGRSLGAARLLAEQGIQARVIDVHTIKPIDVQTVVSAANETGTVLTVEEHSIIGGLGSAVAEVLAEAGQGVRFRRLGIPDQFPTTGPYEELVAYYGLDAAGIAQVARGLLAD